MHDYCNVANSLSSLDAEQADFCLQVRNFRRARPWLRDNYGSDDRFDYVRPVDGRTVFTSLRHGPDGAQVFVVAHMEGKPTDELDPLGLLAPGIDRSGWRVGLRTPSIGSDYEGGPITLKDSMSLVFVKDP
jgi:hypothetical protein